MAKGLFGMFRRRETAPAALSRAYRIPDGRRVYAIGDIHGSIGPLEALLDTIAQDAARRPAANITLLYLGDYVDRGIGTREVIDRAMRRPPFAHEVIHLKGNHEVMLEQFLAEPEFARDWRNYGGLETLASYGVDIRKVQLGREFDEARDALVAAMPPGHTAFMAGLRLTAEIGGYFFCHAGVRPGVPLVQQVEADLLWIRQPFLNSDEDFGRVVVHGHSPAEHPEVRHNRINVDTGAYATGRLTAAVLEGEDVDFLYATTA